MHRGPGHCAADSAAVQWSLKPETRLSLGTPTHPPRPPTRQRRPRAGIRLRLRRRLHLPAVEDHWRRRGNAEQRPRRRGHNRLVRILNGPHPGLESIDRRLQSPVVRTGIDRVCAAKGAEGDVVISNLRHVHPRRQASRRPGFGFACRWPVAHLQQGARGPDDPSRRAGPESTGLTTLTGRSARA